MSDFSAEFKAGVELAQARIPMHPNAFFEIPHSLSDDFRLHDLQRETVAAALSNLPSPSTEAFLGGWMQELVNDADPALWMAMEEGFQCVWEERTDRSISGSVEGLWMQAVLNQTLMAAVYAGADATAVDCLLKIGAQSGLDLRGSRPLWVTALAQTTRTLHETRVAQLLVENELEITDPTARSLVNETFKEAGHALASLYREERKLLGGNPESTALPASMRELIEDFTTKILEQAHRSINEILSSSKQTQAVKNMLSGYPNLPGSRLSRSAPSPGANDPESNPELRPPAPKF